MVSLQILGQIAVHDGDSAVPMPTQKLQALLVLLALAGPMPRARLAAWLWAETNDPSARRNLRRELARLRDAGAGALLQADADQLALADTVVCDAHQFMVDVAAQRWTEALHRWTGPPADGLQLDRAEAFSDWLTAQRQRLQALRRQALAAAAQACQGAGDRLGAMAHLQTLLAEDPLQEHHHRALISLHAAAGHREAALAQYTLCRELLWRELGLQPGPDTEALVAEVRRAKSVQADTRSDHGPQPPPPELAPSEPIATGDLPLVGREADWGALQAAWRRGRLIVIEGEGGIGKTRLARDFAASRGALALAQCRRSDAGVPYASFVRALRALAGPALGQSGMAPWVLLELAHLLPELGDAPQAITTAEAHQRFCEACALAWQTLSAGNFDAVVIDDWHLADEASQVLLGYIIEQRTHAPTASPCEILVLRPELAADAQARQQALIDSSGALHLRLGPLGTDSVYRLVQQLSGATDPRRFAQRLERASGGNPFFLAETLRQWQGLRLLDVGPDGVWRTPFDDDTQDYAELPVPDSVRDAITARVRRLGEPARALLQAASLAAEPFTPALLAGACDLSEVQALAAIEQVVDAELLRERDGGYAFAHDLVQAALDSTLTPAQRRLVHRRLALGAQAARLDSADIARHWEAGGQPERAVAHRMAAAEAAQAVRALADAQAHWQAALDDRPTLAERVRILGRRWELALHRGDAPGLQAAVDDLDAARAEAQATGQQALAVECAVHAAEILAQGQRDAEALARSEACLADAGTPPALRAQALRVQSQVLSRLGRTDEARLATEAALAAGGLSPLQQGDLEHALSYTHFLRGDPKASLHHARQAHALWQAAGARQQAAQAQASIGRALDMLDEREPAWAALEAAHAQAASLRMIDLQRVVANNLANNRLHHGGPARAIEVIRAAQALAPHFTRPSQPVFYLGILAQAHAQLGELGTALDLADEALQRALDMGVTLSIADCLLMTLELRTRLADHDGAQRLLDAMAGRSLAGLDYFGVKVAMVYAGHALLTRQPAAARNHLARMGDIHQLGMPPDRAEARLRMAQLAWAEGDVTGALEQLATLDGQALYTEMQARSCALRLACHTHLGQVNLAAVQLADDALACGAPERVLPALDRLELLRARRDAAMLSGDTPLATQLDADATSTQQRLADRLGRHGHLAHALAVRP